MELNPKARICSLISLRSGGKTMELFSATKNQKILIFWRSSAMPISGNSKWSSKDYKGCRLSRRTKTYLVLWGYSLKPSITSAQTHIRSMLCMSTRRSLSTNRLRLAERRINILMSVSCGVLSSPVLMRYQSSNLLYPCTPRASTLCPMECSKSLTIKWSTISTDASSKIMMSYTMLQRRFEISRKMTMKMDSGNREFSVLAWLFCMHHFLHQCRTVTIFRALSSMRTSLRNILKIWLTLSQCSTKKILKRMPRQVDTVNNLFKCLLWSWSQIQIREHLWWRSTECSIKYGIQKPIKKMERRNKIKKMMQVKHKEKIQQICH